MCCSSKMLPEFCNIKYFLALQPFTLLADTIVCTRTIADSQWLQQFFKERSAKIAARDDFAF